MQIQNYIFIYYNLLFFYRLPIMTFVIKHQSCIKAVSLTN